MGKPSLLIPEIWSKKPLKRFYQETILDKIIREFQLTSSEIIKLVSVQVEALKSEGKPENEIENEIKGYIDELLKVGKTFESNAVTATDTVAIKFRPDLQFGMKIKPVPFTKILMSGE